MNLIVNISQKATGFVKVSNAVQKQEHETVSITAKETLIDFENSKNLNFLLFF